MNKTFQFGQYFDAKRVTLRPIKHLATDLRDRSLLARWDRLTRRWIRYGR